MKRVEYLNPQEIAEHREAIGEALHEQNSSPVIRDGFASNIALKYISKEDAVLDCGPGTGYFLRLLQKAGYINLSAVDIDYYSHIDGLKEFKLADLSFDTIPWPNDFFNAVTAWQIIEHLENPHHFMREVFRILKPGGLFIISMPNIQHIFNRIFFLRKSDMVRWHRKNNHIALFPRGLFDKTFLKYFNVIEKTFTRGEFPYRFLARLKLPNTEWFGRDVIYVFRRKGI